MKTIMKKEINTQITIYAPAQEIWNILLDFEKYSEWNPFITIIKGTPKVGNDICVTITPPESNKMTFSPTILSYIPNKEFIWKGKVLIPGLFDGKHIFEIKDNGDGSTTFIQREEFSGIFVRFFNPNKTKEGFILMNKLLKVRAESNKKLNPQLEFH